MNERIKKLLRESRSKGGKNGSREDKSRAGRLGYQKMLETLDKKAELMEQKEQGEPPPVPTPPKTKLDCVGTEGCKVTLPTVTPE